MSQREVSAEVRKRADELVRAVLATNLTQQRVHMAAQDLAAAEERGRLAAAVVCKCGDELQPNDGAICGACLQPEIAEAEERGRRAGIEERDELRAQVDAARRLLNGTNYLAWANAGGEPECEHGYFIAVPCRACDMALVLTGKARAALAPRDSGKDGT